MKMSSLNLTSEIAACQRENQSRVTQLILFRFDWMVGVNTNSSTSLSFYFYLSLFVLITISFDSYFSLPVSVLLNSDSKVTALNFNTSERQPEILKPS